MFKEFMAMVAVATVSSATGVLAGLPAQADNTDSLHKHHTCNAFVRHISSAHQNNTFAAYNDAAPEQKLDLVNARISKLDTDISDSLAKITKLQNQQFDDGANSKSYEIQIEAERQNLNSSEERLSFDLNKRSELEALLNNATEQTKVATHSVAAGNKLN